MSSPVDDLGITSVGGCPATVTAPDVAGMAGAGEWLTSRRQALTAALRRHGSLLIRGLPIGGTADFAALRDVLVRQRVAYREKATPRSDFGDDVLSSTDLPAYQEIRLHNENSYTLSFPGLLMFCCLTAPEDGGATTVADCREILSRLPAGLVADFRTRGWLLRRSYHPHVGLDWTTAFGTGERAAVEEYCARNQIGWQWTRDGGLVTSQRRAALIRHPDTGDEVWFNHVAFWSEHSLDDDVREVLVSSYGRDGLPFQTRYGDGTPIPAEVIAELNAAYDASIRRERWQPGDLLLVDNILACHGRDPFQGERKIVVAMGRPVPLTDCRPSVAATPGPLV